jgi:hypothetical protein
MIFYGRFKRIRYILTQKIQRGDTFYGLSRPREHNIPSLKLQNPRKAQIKKDIIIEIHLITCHEKNRLFVIRLINFKQASLQLFIHMLQIPVWVAFVSVSLISNFEFSYLHFSSVKYCRGLPLHSDF